MIMEEPAAGAEEIYVVKINQVPRATKTEAESILSKVLDFPSFSEDGLKHWHLLWI